MQPTGPAFRWPMIATLPERSAFGQCRVDCVLRMVLRRFASANQAFDQQRFDLRAQARYSLALLVRSTWH